MTNEEREAVMKNPEVQAAATKINNTLFNWLVNIWQEILFLPVLLFWATFVWLSWNYTLVPSSEFSLPYLGWGWVYVSLFFLRLVKRALE